MAAEQAGPERNSFRVFFCPQECQENKQTRGVSLSPHCPQNCPQMPEKKVKTGYFKSTQGHINAGRKVPINGVVKPFLARKKHWGTSAENVVQRKGL